MDNKKNFYGKSKLQFSLTFHQGWAERPVYSTKGNTSEKQKGVHMLDLITNNFNLSLEEIDMYRKKIRHELMMDLDDMKNHQDKKPFSKDEYGNFISPFASRKRIF